jgi:putative FmdB family regulatory protein
MPTYEYQCDSCGVFEVSQRITEDPLKKCPTCKSKVRRLISNTSFMLKGSGWYATDYGRSKPSSSADSAGSTSGNGKSGESASSSTEKGSSSSTSTEKSSSGGDKHAGGSSDKAASSS